MLFSNPVIFLCLLHNLPSSSEGLLPTRMHSQAVLKTRVHPHFLYYTYTTYLPHILNLSHYFTCTGANTFEFTVLLSLGLGIALWELNLFLPHLYFMLLIVCICVLNFHLTWTPRIIFRPDDILKILMMFNLLFLILLFSPNSSMVL